MKAKIAKWGNSLAVRLPKNVADELGLVPGRDVDIAKEGTRLTIETAPGPKIPHYRLEDLLAQIKPGQKSPPLEDWSAVEPPWPDDDWHDMAPTDEEWDAMRRAAEVKLARRRKGAAREGQNREMGQQPWAAPAEGCGRGGRPDGGQ